MADKQFKASIDPLLANILRASAARWGLSISELIAFCVREKLQINPFTDADMLPPGVHPRDDNQISHATGHDIGHDNSRRS